MAIRLASVDRHNFHAVLQLKVTPAQRDFVASNGYSIAQAYVQPECVPLAVYEEDTLVGFIMYALDETDQEYWVYRLMIDAAFQRRGYGRSALSLVIERIAKLGRKVLYISFEPENRGAELLYKSLGFVPDGRMDGSEVIYRLNLQQKAD